MQATVETRWFQPGACPAAVLAWFDALPGVSWPETRADHYLRPHEPAALGIKVRAGAKVEIKQRLEDLGVREFGAGVRGSVDAWTKWSFGLDPKDHGTDDLDRWPG